MRPDNLSVLKAVFGTLQVLGLILCCYTAEDISDVTLVGAKGGTKQAATAAAEK